MRLGAILPLLSLPVAIVAAVVAQPFAEQLHLLTALPGVPSFKFAIAREDLVPAKQEDEDDVEPIDYKVLTPAAYVVNEESDTGFATIDRRPINERFRLLSVLIGVQGSSALVDKRVVHVGDWLGGYRVVSITRDGLNLRGPRGREHLAFMSTEELALREMPFANEATRASMSRAKAAEAAANKSKKDGKAEEAVPASVKAEMERDYQRLIKDLKP